MGDLLPVKLKFNNCSHHNTVLYFSPSMIRVNNEKQRCLVFFTKCTMSMFIGTSSEPDSRIVQAILPPWMGYRNWWRHIYKAWVMTVDIYNIKLC